MADIGHSTLLLALAFSTYTAVASWLAARSGQPAFLASARRGSQITAALVSLAAGLLVVLLLQRDYGVRYVYEHASSSLPVIYTIAALWAGQEGSLLVWLWLLSLLAASVAHSRRNARGDAYALAITSLVQTFLALLLCFADKPFVLLPIKPAEGLGLNPLLQDPGMIFHPPLLLLGYAAYTIPFAYATSALLMRRSDTSWLRDLRTWSLTAWGALGLGILLGARWAYTELGWGGYWSWDPVENASLIPWLTGTAFLHSVMMQERRGLFKTWNLLLVAGTFLLCVFAAFITRAGFVQSVHAFAPSLTGYCFLAFIGATALAFTVLLLSRRTTLRSDATLGALASREGTFLLTNLLLTSLAAIVMLGTLFPNLTQAVTGTAITLERSFFDRVSHPIALALLALLGICPLLGWHRAGNLRTSLPLPVAAGLLTVLGLASLAHIHDALALTSLGLAAFALATCAEEFLRGTLARRKVSGEAVWLALINLVRRNRRRYGGYIIHLGIVLMAIGIMGESLFKIERQVTLARGEKVAVGPYQVCLEDLSSEIAIGKERNTALVGVYQGTQRIADLRPEYNLHANMDGYLSEAAIRSTLRDDLYVAIADMAADRTTITLHILLNPLLVWLWIGGMVVLGGTAIALWPERMPAPQADRQAVERTV